MIPLPGQQRPQPESENLGVDSRCGTSMGRTVRHWVCAGHSSIATSSHLCLSEPCMGRMCRPWAEHARQFVPRESGTHTGLWGPRRGSGVGCRRAWQERGFSEKQRGERAPPGSSGVAEGGLWPARTRAEGRTSPRAQSRSPAQDKDRDLPGSGDSTAAGEREEISYVWAAPLCLLNEPFRAH